MLRKRLFDGGTYIIFPGVGGGGLFKGAVCFTALFLVDFCPFFLKYLAKISFNQKMTQLSSSPWFNNFLKIFGCFLECF